MLHPTAPLRPVGALVFASGAAALGLFGALGTDYSQNRVFEVSVSQTSSSERVSMEITMNGEPIDRGGRGGGGGGGRTSTFSLTTTDVVLAAEKGAPTRIQRTFDEVSAESSFEMRGETRDVEMESAFEGLTIVLSAEGGEVEVEVTDGDAPEEDRLEGHSLALSLDRLLPEDEVEVGDEWSIEGDDLMAALGQRLQSKLIDRPERQEGGEGRGRRGGSRGPRGVSSPLTMLADGDWEVTATLTDETEDVDGVECVVITIEAEVEAEIEMGQRGRRDRAVGQEGRGGSSETTCSAEFEGRLLWSVDAEHPARLEFEGSIEISSERMRESDRGVMEMSSLTETSFETTIDVTVGTAKDK
ncbi:MAG: hypothetical protein VX015_02675 [Planctomycetota bacterium]|nr:hypothetical protein [Planctomycetota bacterium]